MGLVGGGVADLVAPTVPGRDSARSRFAAEMATATVTSTGCQSCTGSVMLIPEDFPARVGVACRLWRASGAR